MFEAALFRHDGIPSDVLGGAVNRAAVVVHYADALGGEHGDIAVGEKKDFAGVLEKGRDVAGDEVFAFAEADDGGRSHAGGDNFVGILGGKKNERIDAAEFFQGTAHGFFEGRVFGMLLNEVGDNFGIGFGDEFVAFSLELFFELEIIFDDAVVDDDDLSGAVAVGMRVFFGGPAVGGPAGVADAVGAVDGRFLQGFFEIAELAGGTANFELAVLKHSGARGIVAAIFELAESFNNDRYNFFRADVADNAAHGAGLLRQPLLHSATSPQFQSGILR